MRKGVAGFLTEHRSAILERWEGDLQEKFGTLAEDSRLWLDDELASLFDEITERLSSPESVASTEREASSTAPELYDSMEFASKIECLLTGMRSALRVVREIREKTPGASPEETDEILRELEASLRYQVHEEVQIFCRRWDDKSLEERASGSDDVGAP